MVVISRRRRKHMASQQAADGVAPETRPGLARLASFSRSFDQANKDAVKQLKKVLTFQDAAHAAEKGAARGPGAPDTFETTGEHSDADEEPETMRASIDLDDLPIELIALIDGFVESLTAKVHPKPPNIANLSQLFQDFYAVASSHINTHLNSLAIRHGHGVSLDSTPPHSAPAPSPTSTISSAASRLRSKASSLGSRDKPKVGVEQQMITPQELANRKRARRALEAQRNLLEETVERRLCEGIYDRIYRHRSTQDEAQDAKLRSKTATLALVGIGPLELGVVLGEDGEQADEKSAAVDRTSEIREQLETARRDIVRMSESRYPLGKLNRLKAAHKSIVDTLAQFHPSASADEIMPILIYTLITLPPDNLCVISDLNFIQNFRWDVKLNGEAAYCLTNLEAAISFLETVDLATLRADEQPSGSPRGVVGQQNDAPQKEELHMEGPPPSSPDAQGTSAPPESPLAATDTTTTTTTTTAPEPQVPAATLKPEVVSANRRISDLVNTPASAIGAASDVVFSTADHGLKTISSSLGESYSFLLGKLKERQGSPKEPLVVPKTLDDARKLVSTPPPADDDDNNSAEDVEQQLKVPRREDRAVSLITGRRDASADSTRSSAAAAAAAAATSSKKAVNFADDPRSAVAAAAASSAPSAAPSAQQSPAMLDQVRSLGNTFNPMARLSGFGIRGFGRSAAAPAPPVSPPAAPREDAKDAKDLARPDGDLATAFTDMVPAPGPCVPKIALPNQRFLELENPGDLKLDEVVDLLKDYRRLAEALMKLDAFEARPQ